MFFKTASLVNDRWDMILDLSMLESKLLILILSQIRKVTRKLISSVSLSLGERLIDWQSAKWQLDGPTKESYFICLWIIPGAEKAMVPHSSTLAWKIPWTEEPDGLQSMGSLTVGHD